MRELDNVIEHTMILAEGDHITLKDLPASIVASGQANPAFTRNLKDAVRDFEKQHITRVLDQVGQDRREAAKLLDISLSSLYRKIEELEIDCNIHSSYAISFVRLKSHFPSSGKTQRYFPWDGIPSVLLLNVFEMALCLRNLREGTTCEENSY